MKRAVIGILAHVDAGKTTLSERILYLTGKIRRMGRVDSRDTYLDTYEMERARGITIFSKQAELSYADWEMTLLDTPGHVDFSAEMERTLQILDYAVLVISGADGVQGHVETLWQLLARYEVPVFVFVNKMDQKGTSRSERLAELRERLDRRFVDFESARFDTDDEEGPESFCGHVQRRASGTLSGGRKNSAGGYQPSDCFPSAFSLFFRLGAASCRRRRISARSGALCGREAVSGRIRSQGLQDLQGCPGDAPDSYEDHRREPAGQKDADRA